MLPSCTAPLTVQAVPGSVATAVLLQAVLLQAEAELLDLALVRGDGQPLPDDGLVGFRPERPQGLGDRDRRHPAAPEQRFESPDDLRVPWRPGEQAERV